MEAERRAMSSPILALESIKLQTMLEINKKRLINDPDTESSGSSSDVDVLAQSDPRPDVAKLYGRGGQKIVGFCVVCELFRAINDHTIKDHANNSADNPCYDIFDFDGLGIIAPRGTLLLSELSKCPTCSGVFFNHRVSNHRCGLAAGRMIDEGDGPEYCLMCQLRCENVEKHWETEHHGNVSYNMQLLEAAPGTAVRTLLPENTDFRREVVQHAPCACYACLPFTYKNRIRRVCPANIIA